MKNSISIIIFFIGTLFLGSCTVSNMNSKFILGHWKTEQTGPFITKSNQQKAGIQPGGTESLPDTANISAFRAETSRNSMVEFKNESKNAKKEQGQIMRLSLFTGITFNENKTATVYYGKKEFPAKWKMSSSGKKVTLQDTSASKKMLIRITSMDSLHMTTINKFPKGKLQKTYSKQK